MNKVQFLRIISEEFAQACSDFQAKTKLREPIIPFPEQWFRKRARIEGTKFLARMNDGLHGHGCQCPEQHYDRVTESEPR